jgi:hypothetical protein
VTNPYDISMVKRRDQFMEEILDLLGLDVSRITLLQKHHLQRAIAHFTIETLKDELAKETHEAR